jgi:hypothetical protein
MRRDCIHCEPNAAIAGLLRRRLRQAIFSVKKKSSMVELLGCTIDKFRIHLENQFTKNMTWNNHGEWHIDHRRPCASFNLSNEHEQKMCFHFTNLQPLWAKDNLSKNNFFDKETFKFEWNGLEWVTKLD